MAKLLFFNEINFYGLPTKVTELNCAKREVDRERYINLLRYNLDVCILFLRAFIFKLVSKMTFSSCILLAGLHLLKKTSEKRLSKSWMYSNLWQNVMWVRFL